MASPPLDWRTDLAGGDWAALSELYRVAPLGEKPPELLRQVFGNSMYRCFVYAGAQLVGAGRALADGADCACLCDIAVHPRHQGIGLGKAIVERLVSDARGHKKIILYANPGAEAFYLKLGFKPMNTAMAIFADEQRALRTGLVRQS
jgi:GNAT superfamily N-acetyltransferase